jgi:hypothetical protein
MYNICRESGVDRIHESVEGIVILRIGGLFIRCVMKCQYIEVRNFALVVAARDGES